MSELFGELLKAQPDILFMIAGLVLIAIGVVGSIKTYIDPGKWGRIGALGIGVVLLTVGFTLHAREMAHPATPPATGPVSSICTFDAGPLAGSTAQLAETALAAIGSPCHDAAGNKGYIVAPDTPLSSRDSRRSPKEPVHTIKPTAQPAATPGPVPQPAAAPELSRICHFNVGPLSGATHELPRAKLQNIGQSCHDLRGNSGLIVAPDTPLTQ